MTTRRLTMLLSASILLTIIFGAGCGDDEVDCTCTLVMPEDEPAVITTSGLMGPGGGILILDGEVSLGFPAGALEAETDIVMTSDPGAAVDLAAYRRAESPLYTITPRGLEAREDLLVTVHFDPSTLQTDYPGALELHANTGLGWEELDTRLNLELGLAQAFIGNIADIVLTSPNPGEGVYVEYGTVLYFTSEPGGMHRNDLVSVRFDVACADMPQQELAVNEVHGMGPGWAEQLFDTGRAYTYMENDPFLGLGDEFSLDIQGSESVPSAILMGEVASLEVVTTTPAHGDEVSLSGFTVTWDGAAAGAEMVLAIEQSGADRFEITVANTGTYTFTQNQLAGYRAGSATLMAVWQQETPVFQLGFDTRSRCLQTCANLVDVIFAD